MPRFVNTRILGNPRNWVRVWLMAFIALVGYYLFHRLWLLKTGENPDA